MHLDDRLEQADKGDSLTSGIYRIKLIIFKF